MSTRPISEERVYEILLSEEARLRPLCGRFWDGLKLEPQKWNEKSFGERLGGFWVVGIFGNFVIWYNDVESGFSISKYKMFGEISNYDSYATTLNEIVEQIVRQWIGEIRYSNE